MTTEWIKVEDRLPEATRKDSSGRPISDQVLCAIKAKTKSGIRYIVKEGHFDIHWKLWSIPGSQHEVVAWMPMPEYSD